MYVGTLYDDNPVSEKVEVPNRIAVSLIEPQCRAEKIHKKQNKEKKVSHNNKPNKVAQKSNIQLDKKIVSKQKMAIETPIQHLVMQEAVKDAVDIEQKPVEELQEETTEQAEPDKEVIQRDVQQMVIAKQQELDRFTRYLIEKINENKRYPTSARRRGIEGDVDVKFIVLADGGVDGIEILQGKSIFNRATIAAIEDSFPMKVPNSLLQLPKEFTIKLVYMLR